MDRVFYTFAGMIVLILLTTSKPVCVFPEDKVNLREATLSDIEKNINRINDGPIWLHHTGASMYPTIKDGQACLCEKQDSYQEGDIISFFRLNGDNVVEFITHRIHEVTPYGYITKGDNNDRIDYTTTPVDQVFCKIKEESALDRLRGN